jgi:hypothetical protein
LVSTGTSYKQVPRILAEQKDAMPALVGLPRGFPVSSAKQDSARRDDVNGQ